MALGLIGLAVGSLLSAHEKEEEEKQSKRQKPRQTQRQGQRKTPIQTEKRRSGHYAELGLLKVLQLVKRQRKSKTNINTKK